VLTTTGLNAQVYRLYQPGKTKAEVTNIKEAIQLYIEVLDEKSQPILEEHFELLLVAV